MIRLTEVLAINDILIERFGGAKGVRDNAGLESAINRPFIDGNKRTAYVLMRLLLKEGTLDIVATEEEKFEFVIQCAQGTKTFHEIKDWIKSRLV